MDNECNEENRLLTNDLQSVVEMLEQTIEDINSMVEKHNLSPEDELSVRQRLSRLSRLLERTVPIEPLIPMLLEELHDLSSREPLRSKPHVCNLEPSGQPPESAGISQHQLPAANKPNIFMSQFKLSRFPLI